MATPAPVSAAREEVRGVVPKLIELPTAMTAARIATNVFDGKK
jgi:hypothetical protein